MTTEYIWQKSYMTAVLETDWTKIHERLQAAEAEIRERQCVLSEDHGGTADERQAIIDAIHGMTFLRKEARAWQSRQPSREKRSQPATD